VANGFVQRYRIPFHTLHSGVPVRPWLRAGT
jgi:hypothetical protein